MLKILIVEDDRSISDILKMYLCEYRRQTDCTVARTLDEAKALLSDRRYDIVLLDILLDGTMSTSLIDCGREWYPDRPPTFIVISAMTGAINIANRYKVRLISKPFALDTIDEIIPNKKIDYYLDNN